MSHFSKVNSTSGNRRSYDSGSDDADGRILQNQIPDDQNMTVELCVQNCAAQNFTVAGLEFSSRFILFHRLEQIIDAQCNAQHNVVSIGFRMVNGEW